MNVLKRCFLGSRARVRVSTLRSRARVRASSLRSRARVRASTLGLWLGLSLALAASDVSAQEDAAESRSTSFQAVEGPNKEDVPGGPLLVYAYAFIMVALVAYVARLGSLQGKNRAELDRLTRALEHGRPAGNERN